MSLWDIMHEFDASGWLDLIEYLTRNAEKLTSASSVAPLPDDAKEIAKTNFEAVESRCREVGLETVAELAREMARDSQEPAYHSKRYGEDFDFLRRALVANMRSVRCMRISPEFVPFISILANLDDGLYVNFPSALEDLENAGSCLAYDQGTASVFHLMRVMELGLKVFAKALDIPYAPSRESYLSQVERRIKEKHALKTVDWKEDEPYFRDLTGDLQIVKIVWRNPTMHIVRTYSQSEAREIFNAVVAFMKRLAARFSEYDEENEVAVETPD